MNINVRRLSPVILMVSAFLVLASCSSKQIDVPPVAPVSSVDWRQHESDRIMARVSAFMGLAPITITASTSQRSAGTIHDFYSEGDYWWPDAQNPDGPYIRKDGETNPNNFDAHRHAMVRLADIVGTLASAYVVTRDEQFAKEATKHLVAWFVTPETRMNPSLEFGQAIKGRFTGRSIGVIDTLHLVDTARAVKVLQHSSSFKPHAEPVKAWFAEYLEWLNTHPYGLEEKVHPNNHGVSWSLQAGTFADLVGNKEIPQWIEHQFKTVYLKEMMNEQGGFKDELTRTKPYGYSLFIVDVMSGVAQLLSTLDNNLWAYQTADGKGMALAMSFIYPYIKDKSAWPFKQDILYWDDWPARQASLLLGGLQLSKPEYIDTWKTLEADPDVFEIKRNLPIRYMLLWQ